MPVDLLLSSGYLAFARHVGFLRAVEQCGLEVGGLCGTSSGALIGALWAAGLRSDRLLDELRARAPLSLVRPHWPPWRGVLDLVPLGRWLATALPARFSDLPRPFAVGVMTAAGEHALLHDGPLVEAVLASCAIPYLFAPVMHGGQRYADGGAVDRLGLAAWRQLRGDTALLVHLVERSHGPAGDTALDGLQVVHSPRSGASLLGLGDVASQAEESRRRTAELLGAAAHPPAAVA